MKEIRNIWGDVFDVQLEIEDIKVGETYTCNNHAYPKYLRDSKLTVTRVGRKHVFVEYDGKEYSVAPWMLDKEGLNVH